MRSKKERIRQRRSNTHSTSPPRPRTCLHATAADADADADDDQPPETVSEPADADDSDEKEVATKAKLTKLGASLDEFQDEKRTVKLEQDDKTSPTPKPKLPQKRDAWESSSSSTSSSEPTKAELPGDPGNVEEDRGGWATPPADCKCQHFFDEKKRCLCSLCTCLICKRSYSFSEEHKMLSKLSLRAHWQFSEITTIEQMSERTCKDCGRMKPVLKADGTARYKAELCGICQNYIRLEGHNESFLDLFAMPGRAKNVSKISSHPEIKRGRVAHYPSWS